MIEELERVVLTADVPQYHLTAGDIGTVVDISNDGEEYTVEFLTLDGETVAVVPVLRGNIRRISRGEIAHVRAIDLVVI